MTHQHLSADDEYITAREEAARHLAAFSTADLEARHEALARLLMRIRAEEYLRGYDAAALLVTKGGAS